MRSHWGDVIKNRKESCYWKITVEIGLLNKLVNVISFSVICYSNIQCKHFFKHASLECGLHFVNSRHTVGLGIRDIFFSFFLKALIFKRE